MWLEIALAVITIIASTAIGEVQARDADKRSSRETQVRNIFQTVKDKFGVTYNQLDQELNRLDIKLSQLVDATRGSARLSRASKIAREFVKKYPERMNAINNAKNVITDATANLSKEEAIAAGKIQRRQGVRDADILGKTATAINTVNRATDAVGRLGSANSNNQSTSNINTGLVDEATRSSEKKGINSDAL